MKYSIISLVRDTGFSLTDFFAFVASQAISQIEQRHPRGPDAEGSTGAAQSGEGPDPA
jgi:hypothetical protein